MEVLETIEIDRWAGPFPADLQSRAVEALERGNVLYCSRLAFMLEESERSLFSPALSNGNAKNISLNPASGLLQGTEATDAERGRLRAMTERFARAATRLLAAVGATKGKRSAYDQLMLSLHDGAKRDLVYQKSTPQVEIAFPSGPTRLCYTDQVLHAALAGQHALDQTFHLDITFMVDPARSPLKALEWMTGRALVD